ncbi:MAG TPA: transglycosylase SLT domain-containing protein [Chitinophagales bacterium]|nr:transglycosylase SLT domain-containing protein [Chitinophagales bacterium]
MLPTLFKNVSIPVNIKSVGIVMGLLIATNVVVVSASKGLSPSTRDRGINSNGNGFYLSKQAASVIPDIDSFTKKVKKIASRLKIPPEWLMAVMYSESKFDPAVVNTQGTGAVGLIQFTPEKARMLNTSTEALKKMTALEQLDYVEDYFKLMSKSYERKYETLTDFYLAVLEPAAIGEDACYTLYVKPAKDYTRNEILDENNDGKVSLQDIEKRMKRMFPTAFALSVNDNKTAWWPF